MELTCTKCGAVCREPKDEKRFLRRHPKKCQAHARFQRDLANGTASVDYDEEQEKRDGSQDQSQRRES